MTSPPPLVDMQGITVSFGGTITALRDVDFRLHAGEIVALLGDNGAGMDRLSVEALAEVGIDIGDPSLPVGRLSGGERQSIAIARAVHFGSRILVLDEPTSALSIGETRKVLTYARAARDRGLGVIFITHNLHHVFEIADRVTVLFHGQNAGSYAVADLNPESAARLVMEGLPIPGPGP